MSGTKTNFPTDPWIPSIPSFSLRDYILPPSRVSDWINQDTRSWDVEAIRGVLDESTTEAIMQIPVGPAEAHDGWVWKHNKNGNYSTKSAYHAFRERRDHPVADSEIFY
ncbi:unnamed protein product [Linum trigynum]|uniref:Uncharacterized protein n=1 Tax=Linum trigynum TaxID=586398 RepID=A0AAV2E351_9ROSI